MAERNKTSYAILGALSIAPMSGYDIRQLMQQSTKNFWTESDGQLYPTLAKLTEKCLITCKLTNEIKLRPKKIYSITPKGLSELKKWLVKEPETQNIRNEAMLKLFFGANISPLENKRHIDAQKYQIQSKLLELTEIKQQLSKEQKHSPHYPYWLMSIDFGIRIAEAKMLWLEDVINVLNKLNKKTR